jgi:hypothetical protein
MRRPRRTRHHAPLAALIAAGLAVPAPAAAGRVCNDSVTTSVPQPTAAHLAAAGLAKLPLAPESRRVDLVAPAFSNSTSVTNPLFPISNLHSAVLNGQVDGKPLKIETTLLPDTRIVEWSPGQCVKTLVSQFVAYLDGRIEEVALDFYAQADDGSVWYFGEDVFNYRNGVVADTGGTWLAGKEGPAALIMPADPKLGDVNRPENIPGLVFEEVSVKTVGKTLQGPRGPVTGAMVASELHDDGTREDKFFAPGYGEFRSASGRDLEAMALAVPTDALSGPPPAELTRLSNGATAVLAAAAARRWRAASAGVDRVTAAWRAHRARGVPPRLVGPMDRALKALTRAVAARRRAAAGNAAIDVAQAALDLQLRYLPPAEIDRARLDLWASQVLVDAAARNLAGVRGDVSTLEWIRDRIVRSLDSVDVARIDAHLTDLLVNVGDRDLAAASRSARALRRALARS